MGCAGRTGDVPGVSCTWAVCALLGAKTAAAVGNEALRARRCDLAACLAFGGGSGAARTTLRGVPGAASGGARRVESGPSVTIAGSVTAAAMAVPATAAVAMIVSTLLTNSPVSADLPVMVSAVSVDNLNPET